MDLNPSADDLAFRDEVRDFLQANLPQSIRDQMLQQKKVSREDTVRWHKILYAHGWGAPSWPSEYGGTGWTALQRLIFDTECALAGAPRLIPFGQQHGRAGDHEIRQHVAEGALSCRRSWRWTNGGARVIRSRGAGSDLASLKTTAVKNAAGDRYHRQWPEDMDHARPLGRLDLLPGAHQPRGEAAGRHFVPAARHEVSRRDGAPHPEHA